MSICIRDARAGDAAICEAILRGLPDWFGIESSLVQYVQDVEKLPTLIAEAENRPVGFLTLRHHFPQSAEIHCMAIVADYHRRGVGKALVRHCETACRILGVEYLQVKTVGPSRPCEYYSQTRRFYEALGFVPLEEITGYWPGNPCLLYLKRL